MALEAYKSLCRKLIAEGVKPTPTEFAKRGWPYVTVANARDYGRKRRPIAVPGSGTTWTSGKYAEARREVFREAGWKYIPSRTERSQEYQGRTYWEGFGIWAPPGWSQG